MILERSVSSSGTSPVKAAVIITTKLRVIGIDKGSSVGVLLKSGRRSSNVEDRRGAGVSGPVVGGGIGFVVLSLIAAFFGVDPAILEQVAPSNDNPTTVSRQNSPESNRLADFVSVVLADTEDTWQPIFQEMGRNYVEPTLVLFSDRVESACG